jgi:hypothetical protein
LVVNTRGIVATLLGLVISALLWPAILFGQHHDFGQTVNADHWDGRAITLAVNKQLTVPAPSHTGWILAALNQTDKPDNGQVATTVNGLELVVSEVKALTNIATLIQRENKGLIKITNISQSAPIQMTAFGAAFGQPANFPDNGEFMALPLNHARQTQSRLGFMRLVIKGELGLARVVFMAGKTVTVICLNTPDPLPDTCKGGDNTADNQKVLMQNWQGQVLYITNLSAISSAKVSVALLSL